MSSDAEIAKAKGNEAFARNDIASALAAYTQAIALDANNHVYYSNRAACFAKLNDHARALEDAQRCISLNPSFAKGYWRAFAAASMLQQWPLALSLVQKAMEITPGDASLLVEHDQLSILLRLSSSAPPLLSRCCQLLPANLISQRVLQNQRLMQSEAFAKDMCAVSMKAGERIRCMRQIAVDSEGVIRPFTSKEIGHMMIIPQGGGDHIAAQLKEGRLYFVRLFLHYDPATRAQEYAFEERKSGGLASQYDSMPLSEKARSILELTMAEANAVNPLSAHVEARLGRRQ